MADPDAGYQVKAWIGTDDDASTSTSNAVTMDSNKTVTVEFEPIVVIHTLTWSVTGDGDIDRNLVGTDALSPSASGTSDYTEGTVVEVSAEPSSRFIS
ncbi:MAG: hypothetical protein KAJ33_03945, partial [Thermoplasmata archaeon]|nr:hypothetical protein [Thermoplasmata archaeon]